MELAETDKRLAKDIIRRGVLHRHAQWQQELRELLDKPFDENSNEYDRSLQITNKARKFYKEAMEMEDYYRNSMLLTGWQICIIAISLQTMTLQNFLKKSSNQSS